MRAIQYLFRRANGGFAAMAVLALCAVGAAHALAGPARAPRLTADDYIEIQNLYADYAFALDMGDGQARKATFTQDGVFLSDLSDHKPEPVATIAARTTAAGNIGQRHLMLNLSLTPTRDGADGRCYTVIIRGDQGPRVIAGVKGFYFDKLVRTSAGWRFKSRHVWLDRDPASPYRGTQAATAGG